MSYQSSSSGDDNARRRRAAATLYAGYDGRPTSRKELTGWYMYGFAAETFVICGIGTFRTRFLNPLIIGTPKPVGHPVLR